MKERIRDERGLAMITVMLLLALLLSMMVGYWAITRIEQSTTRSTMDSFRGFYAAEAGLNLRAEAVRQTFVGYSQPSGTSPSDTLPCVGGNQGSGDFACMNYTLLDRDVVAYLEQPAPSMPVMIARGETYQNLNADEFQYVVHSRANNSDGSPEALLEMHFKSRLVALFQFAAFYDKDLEIVTGTGLLSGPVHSNGDLYLDSTTSLDVGGQVTSAGDIYRGPKNQDACLAGLVRVPDPDNALDLPSCSGSRKTYVQSDFDPWDGMVQAGLDPLTVPPASVIDIGPGNVYWARADLRVVLDLSTGSPTIKVYKPDGTADLIRTVALAACGVAGHSNTFYDNREGSSIDMLDIDLQGLLDCAHGAALLGVGKGLDDTTDGGLVFYLGVVGSNQKVLNNYGVRVGNANEIVSTNALAPLPAGLTLVSNQAVYLHGNFNALNKKPAAVIGDTINLLSSSWTDAYSALSVASRTASDTVYQAAFMAGTDTTGGAEGTSGQDAGQYNGGLNHFPRLHENWSSRTLFYRGSFVSLNAPRRKDGALALDGSQFTQPVRDWNFDTDFEAAELLPPLPPRFIYLRQELFVRHFEL
jgi:hypothetical protein